MMRDLIFSSRVEDGRLVLNTSDEMHEAMAQLRRFLYDNVYRSYKVHREFIKAKKILSELYSFYLENPSQLERELVHLEMQNLMKNGQPYERVVCDFIASMTDRYAMNLYSRLFFPSPVV
jgi:dGTPase